MIRLTRGVSSDVGKEEAKGQGLDTLREGKSMPSDRGRFSDGKRRKPHTGGEKSTNSGLVPERTGRSKKSEEREKDIGTGGPSAVKPGPIPGVL